MMSKNKQAGFAQFLVLGFLALGLVAAAVVGRQIQSSQDTRSSAAFVETMSSFCCQGGCDPSKNQCESVAGSCPAGWNTCLSTGSTSVGGSGVSSTPRPTFTPRPDPSELTSFALRPTFTPRPSAPLGISLAKDPYVQGTETGNLTIKSTDGYWINTGMVGWSGSNASNFMIRNEGVGLSIQEYVFRREVRYENGRIFFPAYTGVNAYVPRTLRLKISGEAGMEWSNPVYLTRLPPVGITAAPIPTFTPRPDPSELTSFALRPTFTPAPIPTSSCGGIIQSFEIRVSTSCTDGKVALALGVCSNGAPIRIFANNGCESISALRIKALNYCQTTCPTPTLTRPIPTFTPRP